jgi:hypothetical protein
MEAQKYYTPTIEEFYLGFECEILDAAPPENDWKQETIAKFHSFELLNKWLEAGEIRVKCLDEQDILYLGWIKKKEEWYEIENKDREAEITKYRLLFSLYELTENDYHTELFVDIKLGDIEIIVISLGIRNIKNKSELKKIMQMLNIK